MFAKKGKHICNKLFLIKFFLIYTVLTFLQQIFIKTPLYIKIKNQTFKVYKWIYSNFYLKIFCLCLEY